MKLTRKEAQDLMEFIQGEVKSQVSAIVKEMGEKEEENKKSKPVKEEENDSKSADKKNEELVDFNQVLKEYNSLKEELDSAKDKLKDSSNAAIKKTLIEAGVSEVVADLVDCDKLKNSDGEVDEEALSQLTKSLKQGSLELGEELKGVSNSDPDVNPFYVLAANLKEG